MSIQKDLKMKKIYPTSKKSNSDLQKIIKKPKIFWMHKTNQKTKAPTKIWNNNQRHQIKLQREMELHGANYFHLGKINQSQMKIM